MRDNSITGDRRVTLTEVKTANLFALDLYPFALRVVEGPQAGPRRKALAGDLDLEAAGRAKGNLAQYGAEESCLKLLLPAIKP